MPHSNRQRISRCLLAVLAFGVSLAARGDERKLAPVIDLHAHHHGPATHSLEEPKGLIVVAEAMALPANTKPNPTAEPLAQRARGMSAGLKQPQPTVRFAAPFDPTGGNHSRQQAGSLQIGPLRNTPAPLPLAPMIRVLEPIRPAQNPRVNDLTIGTEGAAPLDSSSRINPLSSVAERIAPHSRVAERPSAVRAPRPSGIIRFASQDPLAANSQIEKPRPSAPRKPAAELRQRSNPLVTEAARSPIEPPPTEPREIEAREIENALASSPVHEPVQATRAAAPAEPRSFPGPTLEAATGLRKRSLPVVLLADAEPWLAVLQPSLAASDLPAPAPEPPLTEEQIETEQQIEAFELDVKPVNKLLVNIKPDDRELPKNYAKARFDREGEIAHRIGYSRTQIETQMAWEAPALCYRPLYFEEVNLERHGYKVPVVQRALSAAHFFGRVPLLPYMIVSEGHFNCRYTLGHYRPGDYAPYSLYIPRLRLDASAAEAAMAAGLILAIP